MNELLWDLVGATRAAALAAFGQVGRGDKLAADRAATDALRARLNAHDFAGRIAIGEGVKDGAPGLFEGERVGRRRGQIGYDIAVDPIDGTSQTARGGTDAMAVLALGGEKRLFSTRTFYMRKLAVGPGIAPQLGAAGAEWLQAPVARLVPFLARAAGKDPSQLTVCLLDRPRHERLVAELRSTGCRVYFQDCDVSGTVAVAVPGIGIDACLGIGGAPESVLSAAALRCLGGAFFGMLVDRDRDWSPTDGRVLATEDLARGPVCFAATGVTGGLILRGVRPTDQGFLTHSLALSSQAREVHWVETLHRT
jgi:fructose-1,6-bisphosphatase II / sedoheptulose-1,7-bisphosphatase